MRCAGVLLLVFSFVPLYRVLGSGEDSPFRQASTTMAEATLGYILWGSFTAVLVGVLLAVAVPRVRLARGAHRLGARLESVPTRRWAMVLALGSALLAVLIGRFVYRGFFTNVDEIASFLQARYLAEGALAGRLPGTGEGWLIPNMLMVERGWVSQFPPSHLALLAAGIVVGAPMLVGPILFGMMTGLSALVFPRLLPNNPRVARASALAVALSPFLLFLGAGALSHTSAGAFGILALYAALRARDGSWRWAVLAGASIGVMVSSRPWIGLVLGTIATFGVWLPSLRGVGDSSAAPAGRARWLGARILGTAVGGLPFAFLLGWYDDVLFGSPTTLGYLAAFGPRHGLGLHIDPWGQRYGLTDAIGFTSRDLLALGTQLLETPIPIGAVIGIWLLWERRLPRGAGILLSWALIPVLANGLYWFHSTRMLYESAPAWLALACLAVAPLLRDGVGVADTADARPASASPLASPEPGRRLDVRGVAAWSVVAGLGMAVVLGVPDRVRSFVWSEDTLARVTVPALPDGGPAVVFVHTSWNERLSATLQGAGGMRQDSVISLLRRNTNCELDTYARAREARAAGVPVPLPPIDLVQESGAPADIVRAPSPEGTMLRTRAGESFTDDCARELGSDRFGAVSLAPLLWQGDLPGSEHGKPLFVRDLGPEKNQLVRSRFADRTAWVFVPKADGAPPSLVPYDEAMRVLWGGE